MLLAAASLCLAALLAPAPAGAQALRIQALTLPVDASPGPWAEFRVVTRSRSLPPREFTQRVAIVSAEGIGTDAGVWVELKTTDPRSGTRIERGFFVVPSEADAPGRPDGPRTLRLARLQRLGADGRLFEYPPDTETELRGEEDVPMAGLLEMSPLRAPLVGTIGEDTLRLGRKTLISRVERLQNVGEEAWSDESDSLHLHRAVITITTARCDQVPGTGYTRSQLEAGEAVFAVSDSLAEHALPPPEGAPDPIFYRVDVVLTDMGGGAVPEVTQEPEPAPLPEDSGGRPVPAR
jgi:hypothetical protein